MPWVVVVAVVLLAAAPALASNWHVNVDVANVRAGPSTLHRVIAKARPDEVLVEIDQRDDWRKIRTPSSVEGWIHEDLLSPVERVELRNSNEESNPPTQPGQRSNVESSYGVILIGLIVMYFFPFVVAVLRGHQNSCSILVLNLFLGWTLVGWVVSLAMAVSPRKRIEKQ